MSPTRPADTQPPRITSGAVSCSDPFVGDRAPRDLTQRLGRPVTARAQMLEDYRAARASWAERRENGECMQMEDDDYRAAFPAPTLKAFLIG